MCDTAGLKHEIYTFKSFGSLALFYRIFNLLTVLHASLVFFSSRNSCLIVLAFSSVYKTWSIVQSRLYIFNFKNVAYLVSTEHFLPNTVGTISFVHILPSNDYVRHSSVTYTVNRRTLKRDCHVVMSVFSPCMHFTHFALQPLCASLVKLQILGLKNETTLLHTVSALVFCTRKFIFL